MSRYDIFYFAREGAFSMFNHGFMSFAAIGIITACLLGAVVSAKYANRCDNKKLNRIVGVTLILLSIISLALGRR